MWTLVDDRGNRYDVDDLPVTSGGQADLYFARVAGTTICVAVKLGKAGFGEAALLQERALLQSLATHHAVGQHIPLLHGGGVTEEGRVFLVLEWFDQTAESWARGRPLFDRIDLTRKICESVVVLHAAGGEEFCVHRDIKPRNVLVRSEEDGALRVVLADFGIARMTTQSPTMTTSDLGTDGYMSPEQAMPGERKPTKAWDCFGLGATVYYCLTERAPFSARTDARRIAHIPNLDAPTNYYDFSRMPALADQDMQDLVRVVREGIADSMRADVVTSALVTGLRKALEPDPANRGTALELLGWMHQASAVARSEVLPELLVRPQGHSTIRVLGVILLAILVGAVVGYWSVLEFRGAVGLPDCTLDNGKTCFQIAIDYKLGKGIAEGRVDERTAWLYFLVACEDENYDACTWLGSLYDNGEAGLTADAEIAVAYHRRACSHHNGDGCNRLGYMYEKGLGVEQDVERAAGLYRKSCDYDFGGGCQNFGHLLLDGRGVTRDPARALKYYERSCQLGLRMGCTSRDDLQLKLQEESKAVRTATQPDGSLSPP